MSGSGVVVVVFRDIALVVDPVRNNGVWPFFLELIAKLKEFDEIGHRPFGVLVVFGEIGEAFLDPGDGGFDCRYQWLRRYVLRRRQVERILPS